MSHEENMVRGPNLLVDDPSLIEPFNSGRESGRLLYDLGVMLALIKSGLSTRPVLDVGAGSGWVSEFCARMGFHVCALDIHEGLQACVTGRVASDNRVNPELLTCRVGDAHDMPFGDQSFGHLLCYDSLHHMRDYGAVFSEMFRVLDTGGRAIFVEPGARHSSSPETIAFVQSKKLDDPSWIERDVVLEDVDELCRAAGFIDGIRIVPVPHPVAFQVYPMREWSKFRSGSKYERQKYADQLATINYWDRVIFYVDKP